MAEAEYETVIKINKTPQELTEDLIQACKEHSEGELRIDDDGFVVMTFSPGELEWIKTALINHFGRAVKEKTNE